MDKNKTIEEVMSLFDIGGDDKDDSNDYSGTAAENIKDKPSFDELITDLGDTLAVEGKDSPVLPRNNTENRQTNINAKKETSSEELIKSSVQNKEVIIDVDNIFSEKKENKVEGSIDKCADEAKVEGEETQPVETFALKASNKSIEPAMLNLPNNNVDKKQKSIVTTKVRDLLKFENGKIVWLITSPGDKYTSFYLDKAETIDNLLVDGYIPFDRYKEELRSAHVNLDVPSNDLDELSEKMANIQRWKDRIFEISMHVNSQFYKWDRFMELIRGQLSRVEPESNANKRDGVVFQHLRDMELYFTDLEYLHNQITLIWKNLDSAWETLNRKVTIVLADKTKPERVVYAPKQAAPPQNNIRPVSPEPAKSSPMSDKDPFSEFDSLDESETTNSESDKGSKIIDW